MKEIPAPTVEVSVPPDLTRVYFSHASELPFAPEAAAYHLGNAWWLAEASFIAYDTFPGGASRLNLEALQAAGYTVRALASGNTQFLAIENEAVLILAFRGTRLESSHLPYINFKSFNAHWGDLLTDARFLPRALDGDCAVHEGFLEAYRAIEEQLNAVAEDGLRAGKRLWLCGHSLGAALATIAAYHFRERASGLYTYGSPRVGNGRFVARLEAQLTHICRFVHHRDLVTALPPAAIPLAVAPAAWRSLIETPGGAEAWAYLHTGRVKYISGGRAWQIGDEEAAGDSLGALAADAWKHLREVGAILSRGISPLDQGTWPITYDALADHAPVYYANKLFNACVDAGLL